MPYKIKHIPSGLFFHPATGKHRRYSNVDKAGKLYETKPTGVVKQLTRWKWRVFHKGVELDQGSWEIVEFQMVENKPRPFEPLNMTTALWKQIEPELVDLTALVFCQEFLSVDALLHPQPSHSGDDYPHVVVFNDKWYISDGHHRIARLLLSGYTRSFCRVNRIENPLTK